MVSEFASLLEKVRQLAEQSQALRIENAALRAELAALSDENLRLAGRMREAHDRVNALLATMPAASRGEEAA